MARGSWVEQVEASAMVGLKRADVGHDSLIAGGSIYTYVSACIANLQQFIVDAHYAKVPPNFRFENSPNFEFKKSLNFKPVPKG
jgi:hypothetical protein